MKRAILQHNCQSAILIQYSQHPAPAIQPMQTYSTSCHEARTRLAVCPLCTHTSITTANPFYWAQCFPFLRVSLVGVDPPDCSPCPLLLCCSHPIVLPGPVATEAYSLEDVLRDTEKVKITKVRRRKSFEEAEQDGGRARVWQKSAPSVFGVKYS